MGISMTSSLILFMVLAAGCHGNPAIGRRNGDCQYVAISCRNAYDRTLRDRNMRAWNRGESQYQSLDIHQYCQIESHYTECLGECWYEVMHPTMGRALNRTLEYLCHESRRDRIGEIVSAQCFVDGIFQRSFMGKLQECKNIYYINLRKAVDDAFYRGEENVTTTTRCSLLDNFKDCVYEEVEEMCGEEVVPLAQDILNLVLSEVLDERLRFSCSEQVTGTHNIMKRAVGLLKILTK